MSTGTGDYMANAFGAFGTEITSTTIVGGAWTCPFHWTTQVGACAACCAGIAANPFAWQAPPWSHCEKHHTWQFGACPTCWSEAMQATQAKASATCDDIVTKAKARLKEIDAERDRLQRIVKAAEGTGGE